MPRADSSFQPLSAGDPTTCDIASEALQLELRLQKQLEHDIARIFDESLYSDFEVVFGKLRILTHSCIIKARTNNFYFNVGTLLHVNIGQSSFDELYAFISDIYTECDIRAQEKHIVLFLKRLLGECEEDGNEELEEFLTPKCASPNIEKSLKKSASCSPSTELTKEYYALVPIDGNLEKELGEQDSLSSAFKSIIRSQTENIDKFKNLYRSKPTSLALISSHSSKTVKHSNSCDIVCTKKQLKSDTFNETDESIEKKADAVTSQNVKVSGETAYSPDSLVTDDPSSSSDYLSAAYTCSPGGTSVYPTQLNEEDSITKMENLVTSSDSGLENTGLFESLTSNKDVTLTDVSLTESTLHDLTIDDASNSHASSLSPVSAKQSLCAVIPDNTNNTASTSSVPPANVDKLLKNKDTTNSNSDKDDKQRFNEEIVILESSSLSSETGSWEPVFPPKSLPKKACEFFLQSERRNVNGREVKKKDCSSNFSEIPSLVQKPPFKATSCFIDAASLADEDVTMKITSESKQIICVPNSDVPLPAPSQPLPCSTNKSDLSPNDWSENDNEDSLEQQLENKDPDSIPIDISPTIFEMTPITEDSLCLNPFENALLRVKYNVKKSDQPREKSGKVVAESSNTVFISKTPHNSIMSLKSGSLKKYDSKKSPNDNTTVGHKGQRTVNKPKKYNESSPIISGGACIKDHLPSVESFTSSPSNRRKLKNLPIISGANIPPPPASWVVDMSMVLKPESEKTSANNSNIIQKKPSDKTCESLRNTSQYNSSLENSKSRSSVDSDSSERSSHKFYIDLSTLPVPVVAKPQKETELENEKKNMFSMYIDIGKKSAKEMSAKPNTKNNNTNEANNKIKYQKSNIPSNTSVSIPKSGEPNSTSIFEKYESLCEDPNISISDIIGIPEKSRKDFNMMKTRKDNASRNVDAQEKLNKNLRPAIQEEPEPFVRLSDLDKPAQKSDTSTGKRIVINERMTRSIPESNWADPNQPSSSRSNDVINSFHSENTLSLNRLFPHLRNEFSRSMPGSLSSRTRSPLRLGVASSPGDVDEQISDTSELSSVQSSFCRSLVENSTTEETSQASSLIGSCQSRLGQDLLRMFLEEIAPDVIVEVSGRRIKAHKCILSSRCQYFAGILSGGWVESAGNVIALPPFSYNVVHFALCHVYSGVSTIPDTISIVELATLADMLGLEGLKEAIMFTLKAKYCHHFHKPCAVCTAGVLECFPLCSVYGLDDLYRKCLKWITKYFSRVWPTKAFATLPSELLEKCFQQIVVNMTIETIVNTVMECGMAVETLQTSRWAEVVARMCRRLVHAAAHFIAPKLVILLRGLGSLPPNPPHGATRALAECIAAAIQWAPPEECCRAYGFLANIVREMRTYRFAKPDLLTTANPNIASSQDNFLFVHASGWLLLCEGTLVRAAPRVCCTQAFLDLPTDLRRRLRELGCIIYGGPPIMPNPPPPPMPIFESRSRSTNQGGADRATQGPSSSRSLDIDQMRASFVPYAPRPTTFVNAANFSPYDPNRVFPLQRAIPPVVRTTKAQEERAKFNLSKTNMSQERLNTKAPVKVPFENTRPRYLEPRFCQENFKKPPTTKNVASKMISSSESSRNSSPIQARNLRTSRMKSRQVSETKNQALSQDSLATSSRPRTAEPSTDSLSESQNSNKYATYTKTKHTASGSVDSLKATKCQALSHQAAGSNGKVKTKIPVYQISKTTSGNKSQGDSQKKIHHVSKTSSLAATSSIALSSVQVRSKTIEKKTCSLMNATKSSSAKMVAKVVKEPSRTKTALKNCKNGSKRPHRRGENETAAVDIPVMERSGTFLKDEPTFGDKTTNIDLDQ